MGAGWLHGSEPFGKRVDFSHAPPSVVHRSVSTMRPFSLVVAVDAKLGIGKAGGIPWRLPNEVELEEGWQGMGRGRRAAGFVMAATVQVLPWAIPNPRSSASSLWLAHPTQHLFKARRPCTAALQLFWSGL